MAYSPWAYWLLLLLPVLIGLKMRKRNTAAVRFSDLGLLESCPVSIRRQLRPLLFVARLFCVFCLIMALARPRQGTSVERTSTEGAAMMVVVDRSGSMGALMDYKGQPLNRLETVKQVVADFIKGNDKDYKGRLGDLVGLVVFARYADTLCPLVRGNTIITDFLAQTHLADPRAGEDGTAIGEGLALAAARLQKAEKQIQEDWEKLKIVRPGENPDFTIKSKVIILLTDGHNNAGQIRPMEAAKMAAEWGIRIYTIGIGTPTRTDPGPDEGLLRAIAKTGNGFYARAVDADQLRKIYKKIDELEKTEVKSIEYVSYTERFGPWAMAALAALGFEILTGATIFRKSP
ncbi:MAG TPA: VWA domain-containing protein [Anaerohalosphaeraceae bacterium]|jgi:Ca-activated chloride channel family protein|nr:VWA domain-containing protein [Anaerohalosphaeraceae bacterium]